jgi:tetratricopeptide (TPR) repeat protein
MLLSYFSLASDIKVQYLKSYNYEKMQKYTEAIKVLAPLYEKYANGYNLNLRLGWLFFLNKNYQNSSNYYKKAILINAYSIEAKLGLLKIYLYTEDYDKAQILSSKILKQDFYNYYANYYAIQVFLSTQKYGIAKIHIEKMLSIYPTDILFLVQLSIIYKYNKNPLLEKLYKDILILDPNNVYINKVIKL